jgi:tetratricopeptide (TPR) repeat protein
MNEKRLLGQRNSSDWYKKEMKIVYSLVIVALAMGAFAQKGASTSQKTVQQAQQGTQQVSDAKLKQLTKEYNTAKAAYAKKPKDANATKTYVNATYALGLGTMYAENLPPRQKYSGALAYFREVKKVSPRHKGATDNYNMIADIYRKMGKPVPGEK